MQKPYLETREAFDHWVRDALMHPASFLTSVLSHASIAFQFQCWEGGRKEEAAMISSRQPEILDCVNPK